MQKEEEGVSLFIGLRGINGTLTALLGLRTDFKRKLDLTHFGVKANYTYTHSEITTSKREYQEGSAEYKSGVTQTKMQDRKSVV